MWIQVKGHLQPDVNYRCIPEEEYDALKASHTKLVKALKTADKMLEYVGDPQCDGDGAYQDGHGNVYQCQWCAEREEIQQALAEAEL